MLLGLVHRHDPGKLKHICVLGPILHLLDTRDIPTVQNITTLTFVDNTVLLTASKDLNLAAQESTRRRVTTSSYGYG